MANGREALYLRIRNDTQRGQLESQETEKEPNGCVRKSISTNQYYNLTAERGKAFVSSVNLLLIFLRL